MRREIIAALVALVAVALAAIAGCNGDVCARKSDCAAGMVCTEEGVCEKSSPKTAVDAGVDGIAPADSADASITDAAIDAQVVDAAAIVDSGEAHD